MEFELMDGGGFSHEASRSIRSPADREALSRAEPSAMLRRIVLESPIQAFPDRAMIPEGVSSKSGPARP
jgi:hypothetical protein